MIYEFLNYKKFVEKSISQMPNRGRGFRLKISQELGCKTSFISQVLGGEQDFSLEQGFALAQLLNLSEKEKTYFLLLIQFARAGTTNLKNYFKLELDKTRQEALRFKNRISEQPSLSHEDTLRYYSNIDYIMVHLLTTIPEYQNKEALLKKTGLSPEQMEDVLNFLLGIGILTYEKNKYLPGATKMHLPDDSAIIANYHSNWRVQTIKSIHRKLAHSTHYSSVISITKEDFQRIKTILIKAIEDARQVVNESDPQVPVGFCVDFFEI